jgi:hypothetical protein
MGKKKKVTVQMQPTQVSSLCGLILNRLQDLAAEDVAGTEATVKIKDLNAIFGEALDQFANAITTESDV